MRESDESLDQARRLARAPPRWRNVKDAEAMCLPTRRAVLRASTACLASALAFPAVIRAQQNLTLKFRTIPDPDGWHPSLRLKGDWLVFEITDGVFSGFGEASHSREDERCQALAAELFATHYADVARAPRTLTLATLARKENEIALLAPDFVTATAFSGLNQALYDLLAKHEQVPVWQLFAESAGLDSIPLYTTINRALQTRTREEYDEVIGTAAALGFRTIKCAPFEAVDTPEGGLAKSAAGIAMLDALRARFPELGIRVDFHERFRPNDFFALLPEFERLGLDWLEEPFPMGPDFTELKRRTAIRVAAGELFWGGARFAEIADHAWADVIMPDVKHVGGFGPLLKVLGESRGKIEVSPHNPSGPISTAASLHAAALFPDTVRSLEYAFDRAQTRRVTGERVEGGRLWLSDTAGWGVAPP